MEDQLFDEAPFVTTTNGATSSRHAATASLGGAAEMLLVARLLKDGRKVAKPIVDDDGVDLVVDYNLTLQVKSAVYRGKDGRIEVRLGSSQMSGGRQGLADHVDVLVVHAWDSGTWWLIPHAAMGRDTKSVNLYEGSTRGLSAWREAWHVFDSDWRTATLGYDPFGVGYRRRM